MSTKRIIFGSFALCSFLLSYWLWLDYRDFIKGPVDLHGESLLLTVEKGQGINGLADKLYNKQIIRNKFYFKLYARLNPSYSKLKAGEYRLLAPITAEQLLAHLVNGQVIQYSFTIVEGQTAAQIIDNLNNETKLRPLQPSSQQKILSELEIDSTKLEGWFLPETYNFTQGDSAISILQRAYQEMDKLLEQEWQGRDDNLPFSSPYEALIMASIIEKETGIAAERSRIAGIFVNRLRKNMRLQTDPTVIYGIGPKYNGDITRRDLKTPTPYNTYVIKGLPPTPIAMPSQLSIHAAMHPNIEGYLYFVADGTGGHYFSKTLEEHQKAVRRMLRRNRNKKLSH